MTRVEPHIRTARDDIPESGVAKGNCFRGSDDRCLRPIFPPKDRSSGPDSVRVSRTSTLRYVPLESRDEGSRPCPPANSPSFPIEGLPAPGMRSGKDAQRQGGDACQLPPLSGAPRPMNRITAMQGQVQFRPVYRQRTSGLCPNDKPRGSAIPI